MTFHIPISLLLGLECKLSGVKMGNGEFVVDISIAVSIYMIVFYILYIIPLQHVD